MAAEGAVSVDDEADEVTSGGGVSTGTGSADARSRGGVSAGGVSTGTVTAEDPVVRALLDDLDAGFVELFETYQGLVFSVALRVSGRWADAEDVTADAFLRAYRALSRYEPDRIASLRVRPWLLTIMMNLGRNRWRTAARKPPPEPLDGDRGLTDSGGPVDGSEHVEDAAIRRETSEELARLLRTLPDDQRAAVVLRHVVDLPIAEIATVLGQPQGTVKSHISRGLSRLRTFTQSEEVSDVRSR